MSSSGKDESAERLHIIGARMMSIQPDEVGVDLKRHTHMVVWLDDDSI
jgi:hypothetical protein